MNPIELVKSYDQVVDNIKRFNEDLKDSDELQHLLPYFRAWYYAPDIEMVGPSKFIGYQGVTGGIYIKRRRIDMDGRWTEPELKRWLEALEEGTPEYKHVKGLVESLFERFQKTPNKIARFNAKSGWEWRGHTIPKKTLQPKMNKGGGDPLVDVFVQAYQSLTQSQRHEVAKRIIELS